MDDSTKLPRVLIVDNDPVSQRLLSAILAPNEFALTFCDTAKAALENLKNGGFELVVMEIMLPDQNGFELRKQLRLNEPELCIIFVSSVLDSASRKLLENLSNDPFTFFLRKPVFKAPMLELARRVITGAKERKQHRKYFQQLESDLELASKMQKLMLPDWVDIEDSRFCMMANYMPNSHLSGDYFDLVKLPDGRYFFVVGDISGHGVWAALHMSVVQSLTRVLIKDVKPDNIICNYLNNMNRQICLDFDSVFFITCLVAVIDPVNERMEYMSAGHPGFFQLSASLPEKARYIGCGPEENGGIPLGWLRDQTYSQKDVIHCDFPADSVFVALTDGVLERSRKRDEMLEVEGFCKVLAEMEDPSVLPFSLEETIREKGFLDSQDDMTILALRMGNPPMDGCLHCYRKAIPQSIPHASQLAIYASKMIDQYLHDSSLACKAELVIGEFLNNIIVHGLGGAMRMTPQILFTIYIYADKVTLGFYDMGVEWNYVPTPRQFDGDQQDEFYNMSQAGRGMRIIEEIASKIDRSRICNLNCTKITIPTGAKPE